MADWMKASNDDIAVEEWGDSFSSGLEEGQRATAESALRKNI